MAPWESHARDRVEGVPGGGFPPSPRPAALCPSRVRGRAWAHFHEVALRVVGSSVMVCVSGGVGCVDLRANRDPDQVVGDGHAERPMTDGDRFRDRVRLGVDPRDRPVAGVRDPDRVRTHGEGNWIGSD